MGVVSQTGTAQTGTSQATSLIRSILKDYVTRRILKALMLVVMSATFTFFLVRLMPSNPIEIFVNTQIIEFGMSPDEARNLASAMFSIDLDEPIYLQFYSYLKNMAQGNLGQSLISKGTPVLKIILKFLPWTLFSVGLSVAISFTAGIFLGMLIAYRRNGWADHTLSAIFSIVTAIPAHFIAILLIVFLGVQWKLVPIHAMRGSLSPGIVPGFTFSFIKDVLFHAALPIATYVLTTIGSWMLTMKSSTVSTLDEDYVAVARARGLSDTRITISYVGRNAMLPLFTQLTIAMAGIVGGAFLIESIFVYQGIGQVLGAALGQRDYPVMQAVFLIITLSIVLAQLAADLLYSRLDPRIKTGGGQ